VDASALNVRRIEPEWAMATIVFVGTMGADQILELAVVGDPVNVASRVQDATRDLGEPVLLAEATRVLPHGPWPELVSRGTISLRGKAEPIAVHGVARDSVTVSGRSAHRKELT